jgi:hypothetical protein
MKDINDNSDVDLAIQRVNLALAASDLRNVNKKLTQLNKSRSKASDVTRMNPVYKPKASPGPIGSLRSVERSTPKPTPRAAERGKPKVQVTPRAAERGKAKPSKPKITPRAAERNMPKQTKNRSRGD